MKFVCDTVVIDPVEGGRIVQSRDHDNGECSPWASWRRAEELVHPSRWGIMTSRRTRFGCKLLKSGQGLLAICGFRHCGVMLFHRGPDQQPHGGFAIDNQRVRRSG